MIVSPGRGYVFVHRPKTGGTAMALALEARAMADDILIGDTPKAKRRRGRLDGAVTAGRLWKHSTLRDVRGLVPDAVLDRLVPVTLVRNPWDRVVSLWAWGRAQALSHPLVLRAQALPFRDFVLDPYVGALLARDRAADYVAGGAPPLFLRLEHPTDRAPFEDLLGFALDLPVANVSARDRDWRGYYDAATRARVAEVCADDVARFGYAFD